MSPEKDKKDTKAPASNEEAVFQYVTKKLEKITSALYLITNFFPEHEPLRNSIRKRSLHLLSNTFSIREKVVSDPAQFRTSIVSTMKEIVSLLQVSKDSGLISDMNYDVLKDEFKGLLDMLGAPQDTTLLPQLTDTFFAVESEPTPLGQKERGEDNKNSSTKRKSSRSNSGNGRKKQVSRVKSRRREEIVSLLGELGEVSITDLSERIQGCSQKTIQRELSALIDEGRVVKEGERRWSRYHLAKNKV